MRQGKEPHNFSVITVFPDLRGIWANAATLPRGNELSSSGERDGRFLRRKETREFRAGRPAMGVGCTLHTALKLENIRRGSGFGVLASPRRAVGDRARRGEGHRGGKNNLKFFTGGASVEYRSRDTRDRGGQGQGRERDVTAARLIA